MAQPDRLSDMSARAQRLGWPHASLDIAGDVFQTAKGRIEDNVRSLENQRRLRQFHENFSRSGLNAFIPHRQLLLDSSRQSHLWFRIRFLLRVVFATMIAPKAFHFDRHAVSTPPSSPFEVIGDGHT